MSDDEARRQTACEGKERLTSAALAKRVANRSRGYGRTTRKREAYRCEFCGFWHVGTPSKLRRHDR